MDAPNGTPCEIQLRFARRGSRLSHYTEEPFHLAFVVSRVQKKEEF